MRFAFDLLVRPWPHFAVYTFLGGVIGALAPLLKIYLVRDLIDALAQSPARPDQPLLEVVLPYLPQIGLIVAASIGQAALFSGTVRRYLSTLCTERVQADFAPRFFSKIQAMPLESFERSAFCDTLDRVRHLMLGYGQGNLAWQLVFVQAFVTGVLSGLGILWFFAGIHWSVAVLVFAASVIIVAGGARDWRAVVDVVRTQMTVVRKRDYWQALLLDRRSLPEIRAFGLNDHLLQKWVGLKDAWLGELVSALKTVTRRGLVTIAAEVAVAGAVMLGLILVASQGKFGIGTFVALAYAIPSYLFTLNMTSAGVYTLQTLSFELTQIQEFMDLEPTVVEGRRQPPDRFQQIRLEGIGFTYPARTQPSVANIDLTIQAGERVALVGENGAGKTTLAKLLLGLYTPTTGSISIDDCDLSDIAPSAWMARAGAVFQDHVRYAFTVRENIGFGQLEKIEDLGAIQEAARLASAAEEIENLPNGYETLLGREFDNGLDLSGGQWQKLALARSYLRGAELLVLDEPASALDAIAERELYGQFVALAEGKTVILISHRLGSARFADRILFMKNGAIVEQGTHDALVATGGHYASLYSAQAEWYRER